jgi:hypothetical protein
MRGSGVACNPFLKESDHARQHCTSHCGRNICRFGSYRAYSGGSWGVVFSHTGCRTHRMSLCLGWNRGFAPFVGTTMSRCLTLRPKKSTTGKSPQQASIAQRTPPSRPKRTNRCHDLATRPRQEARCWDDLRSGACRIIGEDHRRRANGKPDPE